MSKFGAIILAIAISLLQVDARYLPCLVRTRRQSFNYNKDFSTPEGHGFSAGLAGSDSGVFRGNVQGQLGLVNTPDHRMQVFGRHEKTFGTDLRQLAPDVNTLGLNYQHKSGVEGFVSGSNPAGTPFVTATGAATIPIANEGRTKLGTVYTNTFGGGIEPRQQFGLTLSHNF